MTQTLLIPISSKDGLALIDDVRPYRVRPKQNNLRQRAKYMEVSLDYLNASQGCIQNFFLGGEGGELLNSKTIL